MEQVIVYTERQPHTSDGHEKSAVARAPSRSAGLSDASGGETMRQFSTPSILAQTENPVKFYPFHGETWYNPSNRRERNAPARLHPPRAWVTSWRLATMYHSILLPFPFHHT